MSDIRILDTPGELAVAAAEYIITLSRESIAARGQFSIALSGGSTPESLYCLLATDEYARRIDWRNVHVFWGDERCVPPDHVDSCYRMARETLLDRVPLPPHQVYRIHGELPPQQAAEGYQQTLRSFFSGEWPRFDLILLGMGEDGHTASLFPGTPALDETQKWVTSNHVPANRQPDRVTLTAPAINAAANVAFLAAGSGKAGRLRQVLRGPHLPRELPSQLVQPVDGSLVWFVDQAAASLL